MIIGHQKQRQFLEKTLQLNRLSHAYLFSGLESLGKKTLALEFIKLINCEKRGIKEKPCQQCKACRMISKNSFPDLFIVTSPHHNIGGGDKKEQGLIQISQIRELQHFLSFCPYYGHWKSVILDGAEKMTPEAQSCLLKTLEEVKGKALLILISSHPEMLLPTIYSRCQTIKFFPVNRIKIRDYFVNQGVPEEKAEMLSNISQGKPGKVIDFLLNPEKLKAETKTLKEILDICSSDFASRFQYVKSVSRDGFPVSVLEVLERYFRYILFLKIGIAEFPGFGYFPSPSDKLKSYPVSKIKKIVKFIETINFLISSTNINSRLALEVLLMEI